MSDYWEDRANQLELLTQKKTDETVKIVNEQFSRSISYINSQVKAVFDRYTKNGGLTESQALEQLNEKQTAEFREKLLERLSKTESKEERKAITSLLDAPAYAHRISMLEALANEIYAEAVTIGAFQNTALAKRLVDIYEQGYYRRTFDIQQYIGEYYDFERLSSGRLRTAISEPWNGKNYSERVWDNTFDTAEKLRDIVVTGIMTGQSYRTIIDSFMAVMGEDADSGARFKASRLIRTEVNYISGKATTKAYEQAGIDEYIYLATLDIKTCKHCGNKDRKSCAELDGKHFNVKDAKVGVNKHPMHPFCRCTDCPYIPGRKLGIRAARDENGKSIQVPGDMTYEQWYAKYVDNSGESGIIKTELHRVSANKGVFAHLPEKMSKKHIRDIAKQFEIDLKGITINIDKNPDLLRIKYAGRADAENIGLITFFPNAFKSREELVRTIFHERQHVLQYKENGAKFVQDNRGHFEKITYSLEDEFINHWKGEGKL